LLRGGYILPGQVKRNLILQLGSGSSALMCGAHLNTTLHLGDKLSKNHARRRRAIPTFCWYSNHCYLPVLTATWGLGGQAVKSRVSSWWLHWQTMWTALRFARSNLVISGIPKKVCVLTWGTRHPATWFVSRFVWVVLRDTYIELSGANRTAIRSVRIGGFSVLSNNSNELRRLCRTSCHCSLQAAPYIHITERSGELNVCVSFYILPNYPREDTELFRRWGRRRGFYGYMTHLLVSCTVPQSKIGSLAFPL
jgi:hypothetical protein